jgi:hypothetical protein
MTEWDHSLRGRCPRPEGRERNKTLFFLRISYYTPANEALLGATGLRRAPRGDGQDRLQLSDSTRPGPGTAHDKRPGRRGSRGWQVPLSLFSGTVRSWFLTCPDQGCGTGTGARRDAMRPRMGPAAPRIVAVRPFFVTIHFGAPDASAPPVARPKPPSPGDLSSLCWAPCPRSSGSQEVADAAPRVAHRADPPASMVSLHVDPSANKHPRASR